MPVKTLCPSCHKKLSVPDRFVGKPIKCPGCSKSFVPTAQPMDVEPVEAPLGHGAFHGIALLPWLVAGVSVVSLLVVAILWLSSGSVTEAKREVAAAQAELAKVRAEAEATRSDLAKATPQSEARKAELDKAKEQMTKARADLETQKSDFDKVKEDLAKTRADSEAQKAELEKVREDLAKVNTPPPLAKADDAKPKLATITSAKLIQDGTALNVSFTVEGAQRIAKAPGFAIFYAANAKQDVQKAKDEVLKNSPWKGIENCKANYQTNYVEPGGAVALLGVGGLHDQVGDTVAVRLGDFQIGGPIRVKAQVFAFKAGKWEAVSEGFDKDVKP